MKPIITNPIEINFLKKTSCLTYKEQIELFEINFGRLLTKKQIGNFRERFNLQPKAKKLPYVYYMNQEQIDFFKTIVKGNYNKDISKLYYEKYKVKLSDSQIKHLKRKYKVISGVDTRLKKGQKAHNHKKIGEEFVRNDGYMEIKIAEPNSWQLKHHYIWEKYNGKIPDGYSVVFLDQDKTNFNLDNLMLVKREDKLTACSYKLFSKDKETTKTAILTAQLINKTKEIRKEYQYEQRRN